MADNGTVGRVQTMYVKGTSERVKKLGDEVAAVLKKPKGQLTKDELNKALDSTDKLRNSNPPLNNVEELNRLSMHQALITRGASEKLMTTQEIMARKDTMRMAVAAPGGGGAGSISKGGGTGPMLPKTGAATGQKPLPAGKSSGRDGVAVQKAGVRKMSPDEHRAWLEKNGYRNVDDHLKSADKNKPVEVVQFKKGDEIHMYVRDGGTPGSYGTSPGTTPSSLAIDGSGRNLQVFRVDTPFEAVKSTAAPFPSGVYPGVGGPGGGVQYQLPSTFPGSVTKVN